jgi:hypothetical protein
LLSCDDAMPYAEVGCFAGKNCRASAPWLRAERLEDEELKLKDLEYHLSCIMCISSRSIYSKAIFIFSYFKFEFEFELEQAYNIFNSFTTAPGCLRSDRRKSFITSSTILSRTPINKIITHAMAEKSSLFSE